MGYRFFRQSSVGIESTAGTAVAATRRLNGRLAINDGSTLELRDEERGSMGGSNTYDFLDYQADAIYTGYASTDELVFWCQAGIVGGIAAVGSNPSVYTFTQPLTAAQLAAAVDATARPQGLAALTLYAGDNQQCIRAAGCYVKTITISGATNKGWQITVELLGKRWSKSTFTALSQPSNILAKNLLSTVFIDTSGAGIGGTQVATGTFYDFTWKHDSKITADHAMDGSLEMGGILRDIPETTLELTGKWNTAMVAEFDAYQALTRRFIRLRNATTSPHRITLDGCYSPMKITPMDSDRNGTTLSKLSLMAVEDSTWTKKIEAIIETA